MKRFTYSLFIFIFRIKIDLIYQSLGKSTIFSLCMIFSLEIGDDLLVARRSFMIGSKSPRAIWIPFSQYQTLVCTTQS